MPNWVNGERFRHYRFSKMIEADLAALRPDNWHAVIAILEDYAIIAGSIALCWLVSWWFYPLVVFVIGARQRGLSTILHDSAHRVCAKNRVVNGLLGSLFTAYPIFQRHFPYKESHVQTHHPLLGDPERDPDLNFFIRQGAYDHKSKIKAWLSVVIWPLLGGRTFAYLGYLVRYRFARQDRRSATPGTHTKQMRWLRVVDRFAFYMFWIALLALSWAWRFTLPLLLFWFVPYMTAFHTLGWFIELSEHTPLMAQRDVDLYMTRNRRSGWLERFFTGIHNDHHHLDHHLDTRIPFYHLPKAREIRLRDPNYAAIDAATGGLFFSGPQGAPSALSVILDQITNGSMAAIPENVR